MDQPDEQPELTSRLRRILFGPPRDLRDRSLFHRMSLIPILAWIGLGADGLSSSAYGPEEAFRALGTHSYLAVGLAGLTALTVFIIAAGYSSIIEHFPQGGGGYLVATSLLGSRAGVVSGCALMVDYVLTISVSIASAGAALFSFVDPAWHFLKVPLDIALIVALVVLNIRGVRESVLTLAPIFIVFAITHLITIVGGLAAKLPEIGSNTSALGSDFRGGFSALGLGGMVLLFLHAYSLGGGTYTGIEAVSNGLPLLREPRVQTGKRTMLYMAISLAFTAGGLLLLYLLWHIPPHTEGKTTNAVLLQTMTASIPGGQAFTLLTMLSAAALLIVGAQAGFAGGPRVLVNMAIDFWMPHRFSQLSERLTTQNGIFMMGVASAAILLWAQGSVHSLGIHTLMNVLRAFPGHYKNIVFMSVGVLDSGEFKGERSVEALRAQTEKTLQKYVDLAKRLGIPAAWRCAIGTDVVEEAEKLCLSVAAEFPRITFFAGKIIFKRESWYQPILHNETALALQKRLHWAGHVLVVMPARVR